MSACVSGWAGRIYVLLPMSASALCPLPFALCPCPSLALCPALFSGRVNGEVFESTKARGKPIVYLFGSRPFTGGICAGEEVTTTATPG